MAIFAKYCIVWHTQVKNQRSTILTMMYEIVIRFVTGKGRQDVLSHMHVVIDVWRRAYVCLSSSGYDHPAYCIVRYFNKIQLITNHFIEPNTKMFSFSHVKCYNGYFQIIKVRLKFVCIVFHLNFFFCCLWRVQLAVQSRHTIDNETSQRNSNWVYKTKKPHNQSIFVLKFDMFSYLSKLI